MLPYQHSHPLCHCSVSAVICPCSPVVVLRAWSCPPATFTLSQILELGVSMLGHVMRMTMQEHASAACSCSQLAEVCLAANAHSQLPTICVLSSLYVSTPLLLHPFRCSQACTPPHAGILPFMLSHALTPDRRACPLAGGAGYFCSAPSQQGRRLMAAMAEENNNSREQAVWLVYKWEALQPLSHYAAAQQSPRAGGILARAGLWGSREDAQQAALSARCTMVRSVSPRIMGDAQVEVGGAVCAARTVWRLQPGVLLIRVCLFILQVRSVELSRACSMTMWSTLPACPRQPRIATTLWCCQGPLHAFSASGL